MSSNIKQGKEKESTRASRSSSSPAAWGCVPGTAGVDAPVLDGAVRWPALGESESKAGASSTAPISSTASSTSSAANGRWDGESMARGRGRGGGDGVRRGQEHRGFHGHPRGSGEGGHQHVGFAMPQLPPPHYTFPGHWLPAPPPPPFFAPVAPTVVPFYNSPYYGFSYPEFVPYCPPYIAFSMPPAHACYPPPPPPPPPVEQQLSAEERDKKIQKQIEYYFSENNLCADYHLKLQMDEQGWVPVALIAGFRRIRALTTNLDVVLNSISSSTVVEVQDGKVRRRTGWEKYVLNR